MSVISGVFGAVQAGKASDAQSDAADRATDAMLQMFYQGREDSKPYRDAGEWALSKLTGTPSTSGTTGGTAKSAGGYWTQPEYTEQITGYRTVNNWDGVPQQEPIYGKVMTKTPEWVPESTTGTATASTSGATGTEGLIVPNPGENFTKSPGYDFRMQEGLNALDKSMVAKGQVGGAQLKAVTEYGQGFASNEYGKYLDQYYQSLNPYLSLAGLGQVSSGQSAGQATTTGQNIGENALYQGSARASGYINQANALSDASSNAVNGYMLYKYLNKPA